MATQIRHATPVHDEVARQTAPSNASARKRRLHAEPWDSPARAMSEPLPSTKHNVKCMFPSPAHLSIQRPARPPAETIATGTAIAAPIATPAPEEPPLPLTIC